MIIIENCAYGITDADVGEINGLLRELSPKLINFAAKKGDVQRMLDRSFIFLARDKNDPKDKVERGTIVGMVTLILFYKLTGLSGVVEETVVRKSYRGKGIGKMLMNSLIKEARERHVLHLDLTSKKIRASARALYQQLGFLERDTTVYRLVLKSK